jgi:hypothetical protein
MIIKNNPNKRKMRRRKKKTTKKRKDKEEDEYTENHGNLLSMAYIQVVFKILCLQHRKHTA